jgi:CBS domain containing-hemolysin-like protein
MGQRSKTGQAEASAPHEEGEPPAAFGDEVQGLVTPLDILEAIAGEFPDADETPDIVREGEEWRVKGLADLHQLEQSLGDVSLVRPDEEYLTLAGLLLAQNERMPAVGESFRFGDFRFEVLEISNRRVGLVRISRVTEEQVLK